MLQLRKLKATNFRSWKNLELEFLPGITLLTGPNGAGKTTIRYAVQYALTGGITGFKKAELRRNAPNVTNMFAELTCDIDGTPTVIKRMLSKTEITQSGSTFGVREAVFMQRIKTGAGFVFLSAEQAHFVDVPEFKRKEMLNTLITEVAFLRKDCTQRCKDFIANAHNKRTKLIHEVDGLYLMSDELQDAHNAAVDAIKSEQARLDTLEAMAEQVLPMTFTAHTAAKTEIAQLQEQHTAIKALKFKCTEWVTKSYQHNQRLSTANVELSKAVSAIENLRTKRNGILDRLEDAQRTLVCDHCNGEVVCKECGKPVVVSDKTAQITELLTKVKLDLDRAVAKRDTIQARLGDTSNPVAIELIENTEARVAQYTEQMGAIRERYNYLNEQVQQFAIASARAEELDRVASSREHLDRLKQNAAAIASRVTESKRLIKRKTFGADVLERTAQKGQLAVNLLYEKMPAVYYNLFLTKLEKFCQFLLSEISDMTITLGATEEGIQVMIDDKKAHQLSTGEKQRVRIATTLAFSLMAPKSDTLFIDEVFDAGLDSEGVALFVKLLNSHMRNYFEKIILVSHRPDIAFTVGADRTWVTHVNTKGLSCLKVYTDKQPAEES